MLRYLVRRFLNGILVLAGVIVVIFFLFNVLPADPARMMLGQNADSASVVIINRDLGVDQPVRIQFLRYVNDLLPLSVYSMNPASRFYFDKYKYEPAVKLFTIGDKSLVLKSPYLRRSYQSRKNVSEMIMERFPDTAVLALAAIIFATLSGIALGVIAALRKGSVADKSILALSMAGVSLPSFFASVIFAWLFGFVLSEYTGLNMTGGLYEIDPFKGIYINWKNLILPAFVLGLRPMAIIVQLTRSSMLDVLSQDYIRTARAKGLNRKTVVYRHALRNALNPVVTAISGWLGSLLAGAVFIEFIFGWNGIGKLTVTALQNYDLPVVMGIVLFISVIFILINIVADIINGILDPRIRISE
jgi:peptide/nickel transport system permease protein